MIFPKKEEFLQEAKHYNRLPVYLELNLDEPGHLLLLKVMEEAGSLIFLESLGEHSDNTRFSFLGINPRHTYRFEEGTMYRDGEKHAVLPEDAVFDFLKEKIETYSSPSYEKFGHFNGGLAGYFGYEMVNYCGILRRKIRETKDIPQILLMHIDEFICHDNETGKYYIAVCAYPEEEKGAEAAYESACKRLEALENEIIDKISKTTMPYMPSRAGAFEPEFKDTKDEFKKKVSDVVGMVDSGEALQVVLSMRADIPGTVDPYKFYLRLRKQNPSPYMFYVKCDGLIVTGSSPEVHVKSDHGLAKLRPIAGTVKRTGNEAEDRAATEKLLADPKERAEHLMLVDLARNDLSRIAKPESVNVTRFMQPENYSHVIHLVSDVESKLDEKKHIVDVLKESFPAGTVSGAPKVRAIEIIDEFEKDSRQMYAGAVGYIGFNNFLDTCITIRTAYFTPEANFIQAGAGIVQDSVPENEYEEIRSKLRALSVSIPYAISEEE